MLEIGLIVAVAAGAAFVLGRLRAREGLAVDDDVFVDLPCPWCLAPTSEDDIACPSCLEPFGVTRRAG